jgi:hypothetical protein
MAEADIEFLGPIPSNEWLESYQRHFQPIRDIARTEFSNYFGSSPNSCTCLRVIGERQSKPYPSQIETKQQTVAQLRTIASRCRKQRQNEAGWRDEIEVLVFGRLAGEVVWSIIPGRAPEDNAKVSQSKV